MVIELTFDYVDPGSYLAEGVLRGWRAAAGAEEVRIERTPLELRTPEMPPLDPTASEWATLTERVREEAGRAGIPFETPRLVPWTRKAHELARHADEKGRFEAIHEAIFSAHFVRGLDIGRVDVLTGLAAECGLDPSEVRTVLGVDRFRPEVERVRFMALEAGLGGVPTVESGGRRLEGFETAEELWAFLEEARRG